jgi:aminobenzoyl-glutamate utilization protein B
MQNNMRALAHITYTEEERRFAVQLQKSLDAPADIDLSNQVVERESEVSKGSTDVGDISWVTPTAGFRTACWVPGTPSHSWQATAAGGTTIGRKGMELAARVLAASAWDLAHDADTLARAKQELARRTAQFKYTPMLEKGQKPPLNYRNAPDAGAE